MSEATMREPIKITDVLDLCWQKAGMIVADDERWTKDELRAAITAAALLAPKPQAVLATPASDAGEVRERVAGIIEDALTVGWDSEHDLVDSIGEFTDKILALLIGTPQVEGEALQSPVLREGLKRIAQRPCTVYVKGYDCISVTGLQAQDARYKADGMCDPCTARFALRSAPTGKPDADAHLLRTLGGSDV